MAHKLLFSSRLSIGQDETGLLVPITVSISNHEVKLEAYLDTGAKYCVFPRWMGEDLGIQVEAGLETDLTTGGGPMPTYLHYVTLYIGDLAFDDVPVCFAKFPEFARCLLGRGGWLQSLRIGLVVYDGHLYLNSYDE
jgi:hypothetical protein